MVATTADGIPEIMKSGGEEHKGELARLQYFIGAIAVGDMLKSTLGPMGMDKILQPMQMEGSSNDITITNDGATILTSVWLDNPSARILADVARQQDVQCGDGTTGVVVLAAEFLRAAEKLIECNVHPQIICQGYLLSRNVAQKAMESVAVTFDTTDEACKKYLLNLARTSLSSKLLCHEKDYFAKLAVDAVLRIEHDSNNLQLIQIIKKPGGSLSDSFLDEGFILPKKIGTGQPTVLHDCNVLIANTAMDTDKIKIYGARVHVDSFTAVSEIEAEEKEKMKKKVDKILKHNCNVFINRQLIYNYPEQLFKDAGVMAIEHSDFDNMERLACVLGGDIVSTFNSPENVTLGYCKKIEEKMLGEEKVIHFSGCKESRAATIVLRGSSKHNLDEAERSLHDAIAVVSQSLQKKKFVYGGGSIEMAMADAVEKASKDEIGKIAIAMESYANSLRKIPQILLENGGHDSIETIATLKTFHHYGKHHYGVDCETGGTCDVKENGIIEAYKSKTSQIYSATEAAQMIIRCDEIIKCAVRERRGV